MNFRGNNQQVDLKGFPLEGRDNHSFVEVKWTSEMEKKFYLHMHKDPQAALHDYIRFFNIICEHERVMQGHDDEPDDEDLMLV